MTIDGIQRLAALDSALDAVADLDRAAAMAAYMKSHFEFYGVPAPERRSAHKDAFGDWKPTSDELLATVNAAWARREREMQYVACDLLDRHQHLLREPDLASLRLLIVTKSWWDSVDGLAPRVGWIVLREPAASELMDAWIDDDNLWLRRVALIHQLRFKAATDRERLFGYCTRRADEREFFIRKAIGWALREFAKTDADAVRAYVVAHEAELSGLSKREALKNIGM